MNSLNIFSENENIRMQLPNDSSTETHYLSSEKETHVITLSYQDDIVYILSVEKTDKDEDEDDCDLDDEDIITSDLVISGHQAKHTTTTLDGVAAKELLYGWAGKTFADQLINKGTSLELHMIGLDSADHSILLIVWGPNDQSLEAKALRYANSLEIDSY